MSLDSPQLDASPHSSRRSLVWEVCIACAVMLGFTTLAQVVGGSASTYVATAVVALQLYLPFFIFWVRKEPAPSFGLSLHAWRSDASAVAVLCMISFPLYALGHHWWWTQAGAYLPGIPQKELVWSLHGDIPRLFVEHLLLVALPEELFYRGYLQDRLRQIMKDRGSLLGVPVGWSIVVAAAIFAVGHFLGTFNPVRLGPFFPGLVFGILRVRSGTIFGAVLFHGLSNIFSAILFAAYH